MENASKTTRDFFRSRTLVSPEVDSVIEQIIDLILRDYFYKWASDLLPQKQPYNDDVKTKVKNELWILLRRIITRLQRIDTVTFFTTTAARHLQDHFKKFNLNTSELIEENQRIVIFNVSRHLEDERAELEYLRKISEFMLKLLLPYEYATSQEFVHLMREVLTCHVFYRAIDTICDPFFINQQAIIAGHQVTGPPQTSGMNLSHQNNVNFNPNAHSSSAGQTLPQKHQANPSETSANDAYNNLTNNNQSTSINHQHHSKYHHHNHLNHNHQQNVPHRAASFSYHSLASSKPIHKAKVKLKEYKQKMMCEIFELRGGQHWLRRTVVMFFHLVFDKTIDKQVRDCLSGVFSETAIARYLVKFRDIFWPSDGTCNYDTNLVPSDDDQRLTYLLAKQHLINNIPDVFVSILGQKNARLGFAKVFEALQCKKANKQLLYDILESFLYEFSPELKA